MLPPLPPTTRTVRIERAFEVPVALLYRAWTEPELLARWVWGPLGRDVRAELELEVGGRYRAVTRAVQPPPDSPPPAEADTREECALHGEYLEIVPEQRLVFTLEWDAPMGYRPGEERVTVHFRQKRQGSGVEFVHEGIPDVGSAAREHERGWSACFDALAELLASLSAA